jgi:hypothetical protein
MKTFLDGWRESACGLDDSAFQVCEDDSPDLLGAVIRRSRALKHSAIHTRHRFVCALHAWAQRQWRECREYGMTPLFDCWRDVLKSLSGADREIEAKQARITQLENGLRKSAENLAAAAALLKTQETMLFEAVQRERDLAAQNNALRCELQRSRSLTRCDYLAARAYREMPPTGEQLRIAGNN